MIPVLTLYFMTDCLANKMSEKAKKKKTITSSESPRWPLEIECFYFFDKQSKASGFHFITLVLKRKRKTQKSKNSSSSTIHFLAKSYPAGSFKIGLSTQPCGAPVLSVLDEMWGLVLTFCIGSVRKCLTQVTYGRGDAWIYQCPRLCEMMVLKAELKSMRSFLLTLLCQSKKKGSGVCKGDI